MPSIKTTLFMNFCFQHTMRWFGPGDPVSLRDIRQSGATGVITALHQYAPGEIWPVEAIRERQELIMEAGLEWSVVESVNVHEDIKRRLGNYTLYTENYKMTLRNLAACGIKVVIYNFMPVIDWVRTDLYFTTEDGSKSMYFEKAAFEAFDLFVLKRPEAEKEYTPEAIAKAKKRFERMTQMELDVLLSVMLAGLPGSDDHYTLDQILIDLGKYKGIDSGILRQHLKLFLQDVCPTAEELGIKLAIHPDDPPFPVLGLPRITSTEADLMYIMEAVPSDSNGICFCTGSLSARPDNDLPGMAARLGKKIFVTHLRSTQRDEEGNFFEANHLEGSVDMYLVMKNLIIGILESGETIPLRPDHGHQMMDDLNKPQKHFGYSAIGRMRGLAELRGLELGIIRSLRSLNP